MNKKDDARKKRHGRIRKKMVGTAERPRLAVHRSSKNIYVQVVDDVNAKTLISFSTMDKSFPQAKAAKVKKSETLGQVFAAKLKEKGINKIAFDRGGYPYHGRIKAFADAAREAGLEF